MSTISTAGLAEGESWSLGLQRTYNEVVDELRAREVELSLPPGSLVEKVPLDAIPWVGVEFEREFWASHALAWLESRTIDAAGIARLNKLSNARSVSQRTRHRAKALGKRASRLLGT